MAVCIDFLTKHEPCADPATGILTDKSVARHGDAYEEYKRNEDVRLDPDSIASVSLASCPTSSSLNELPAVIPVPRQPRQVCLDLGA